MAQDDNPQSTNLFMEERLHAYLAHAGVASRRKAEGLIQAGKVAVNGRRVTKLGTKVDGAFDKVTVEGKLIQTAKLVYYAVHKPVGVVSARSTPRDEEVVTSLVPPEPAVVPVGRLDKRSSGLMILTNDGPFAYELTHPKFEHEKGYEVIVRAPAASALSLALERLGRGVRVNREREEFDQISVLELAGERAKLSLTLHTGKKRQIRRMVAAVGLAVDDLKRVRIGRLVLGSIKPGQWRAIRPTDVLPNWVN